MGFSIFDWTEENPKGAQSAIDARVGDADRKFGSGNRMAQSKIENRESKII